MSWLSDFAHPGRAYKEAQDEMQKYYDQSMAMQQPYNQYGMQAYGPLSGAMSNLLDPTKLQSGWAGSYEMSPYAQQLQQEATGQGMDAASAMGLLGSSPAIRAIQQGASNIMSADRQQYLNDLMQKYLAGAGLAQGLYNTGASTAANMGQQTMQMGDTMAGLKAGQRQAGAGMIGQGIGALAGAGGSFLGGPAGGVIANRMFQK